MAEIFSVVSRMPVLLEELMTTGMTVPYSAPKSETMDGIFSICKKYRLQPFSTEKLIAELKRRYRSEMAIMDYLEMIECELP
jgi:hypothetical protein